jgi:hypothetical protein
MPPPDPAPLGEWGHIGWARVLLRILITLSALLAFLQPVSASSYLSGNYNALHLHYLNAFLATTATGISALLAVLTWRRGDGAGWPAAVCGALFLTETTQIILGYNLVLAAHIVIGSLIVTSYLVLLLRVWRPAPKADPSAATSWR